MTRVGGVKSAFDFVLDTRAVFKGNEARQFVPEG